MPPSSGMFRRSARKCSRRNPRLLCDHKLPGLVPKGRIDGEKHPRLMKAGKNPGTAHPDG